MHAIRVSKTGGPEVLEYVEVDRPRPKAGEALVRIEAVGVNFIDVYHRTGLYKMELPFTPGSEAAGVVEETGANEGAAGTWRNAFMRGGFFHDAWVQLGMVNETFETAVTWDAFERFHEGVLGATRRAVDEACGQGLVSCRFTHVYPDGPAPYYTVLAPGRPGAELEQWEAIKSAASEAIIGLGGTITHHHSVGRYHRPWYDRERPALFAEALRAAKRTLDPQGILNPGVLIDP